jgi:hypothetical protein
MCRPDSQEQPLKLVDFDRGLTMETIDGGSLVVPFWSECASRTLACGNASRTRSHSSTLARQPQKL